MDTATTTLILGALGSTIAGMAGFIVYLIKYVLADKDKQITELRTLNREVTQDRDEWISTAVTALKAAEVLAKPIAEQAKNAPGRRG